METTTFPQGSVKKSKKTISLPKGIGLNSTQKPQKKAKVILGIGSKYGWVSDTLFDEDLKGW